MECFDNLKMDIYINFVLRVKGLLFWAHPSYLFQSVKIEKNSFSLSDLYVKDILEKLSFSALYLLVQKSNI